MAFRYAAHRSIRVGTCNICQRYGKLSWDHVPPKGSVASEAVEVNPLFRVDDLSDARPVFLQDGVKFRTICPDCNSRIGRRFDPSLINFTRAVKGLVSSSFYLPPFTVLDARPNAIARAVLGHLLAARISDDEQGFDSLIRPSVLDETLPIPQQLEIYYWLYPSGGTVIARHIVVPRGNDDAVMISVLKFHPIAFLVTDSRGLFGLRSLTENRSLSNLDEARLTVDLGDRRAPQWPEQVGFSLMGQDGIDSIVSRNRNEL